MNEEKERYLKYLAEKSGIHNPWYCSSPPDDGDDGFSRMFNSGEYLPDRPAFEIDKDIDDYFSELHMKKKKEGKKTILVSKKKLKKAEKKIQELELEIERLRKENKELRKWDEI